MVFAHEYLIEIPDFKLTNKSLTNVKMKTRNDEKLGNTGRPWRCSSVERTARLEGPFGGAAEYLNAALCPGEDVASRRFAVAGGQVVDLGDRKFPIPDI